MKIKNIHAFLEELNADPRSILVRLQEITERSIAGVYEQKISPRSESPVECLVFDLRTAVAAQKLVWDISSHLVEINEAVEDASECKLVFADFVTTGDNGSQS